MPDTGLRDDLPSWLLPAVLVLMLVSLVYSVLVTANVLVWLAVWSTVLTVGLLVYVVFLLYRLVVAVEEIAENI